MTTHVSRYFYLTELACSHCGKMELGEPFLAELDRLREAFDGPLVVSSGYRCAQHPVEAKKAAPGAHNRAAIDACVYGATAYRLLGIAQLLGWTGIGVRQKGPLSSRYLHLDREESPRGEAPRPTVWSY